MSLDTCAGWWQVEAAVVLGRQVTVVELTASVNTNSSQRGILTQIQIQGDDGSPLHCGDSGAGGLRLWRKIFWYVPRPPAFCHCIIANTDVCVNRQPAIAGVYWLPYRRKDMGIAVRFPAWERDFSVLYRVPTSSATLPTPHTPVGIGVSPQMWRYPLTSIWSWG